MADDVLIKFFNARVFLSICFILTQQWHKLFNDDLKN